MARIRIAGTWKEVYKKIRIGGLWKDSCWRIRIGGLWRDDGCGLNLILPPRVGGDNATIDLKAFIDANNPKNKKTIKIINESIQPQIITGDLSSFKKVTLENTPGAEIQGNVSGGNGFIATSNIILINNGWIRGAGGNGGTGGKTSTQSITVGAWFGRGTYDDGGPYIQGQTSSSYTPGSYYNRFWKTAGGANSGAWTMTGGVRQEYWNTATAPFWGNQGRCHYNTSGSYSSYKNGHVVALGSTRTTVGGAGGSGGTGQVYNASATSGLSGTNGVVYGTSPGFSISTGYNYAAPDVAGYFKGGTGGTGGAWATRGASGSASGSGAAGSAGQYPGLAIKGFSFLQPGSVIGQVDGQVLN